MSTPLQISDLGLMDYRAAWRLQEQLHADVVAGAGERLLLIEHPPVITFGRRPESAANLLASQPMLDQLGVQVVHSDRGGDVTFHGPGQLVVYPIIRLNDHALSVGGYVRSLENSVIAALASFNLAARRIQGAVGVWIDGPAQPAKVCAIGVRIRRGVSMHGLALNVTTDLSYFNLIVPCGLQGKPVTSLQSLLGPHPSLMDQAKSALTAALQTTYQNTEAAA